MYLSFKQQQLTKNQSTTITFTNMSQPFSLDLGLHDTHVLVTGGCGLIGRVVVQAFLAAGAHVSIIDLAESARAIAETADASLLGNAVICTADISSAEEVEIAFNFIETKYGPVECCIALASIDLSSLQQTESICDMDPAVWQQVFNVNINGTFLTCQRWLRGIRSASQDPEKAAKLRNVSLVLMGSESGKFGVRTMAAYGASKAAVQYGLLQSLAKDVPKVYLKGRVNAVAPGAVDTSRFKDECERFGKQWAWEEYEATVGMAKPPATEDVARTFLFLASDNFSGSTHGQVLHVDGGKMGSVQWMPEEIDARR